MPIRRRSGFSGGSGGRRNCGALVDRLADAQVSAAAAEIAVHSGIDIFIGGLGVFGKQGRG